MKKTNRYSISYCICPKCENKFPIPRKSGATRRRKHIKTIWCPFCKERMNMMEIRDQDFYQNGQGSTLEPYIEDEDAEEKLRLKDVIMARKNSTSPFTGTLNDL